VYLSYKISDSEFGANRQMLSTHDFQAILGRHLLKKNKSYLAVLEITFPFVVKSILIGVVVVKQSFYYWYLHFT